MPADGASGVATWNIGSVVTETEDDSTVNDITPYIRATYSARINNDLVTDVGDTLQNSATANYTNGDTGAQESINDTTAPIIATEPSLTAATALTNVTPGKNAGDPLAFGDIAQYVLTVPNFGNAIAHDVNIVGHAAAGARVLRRLRADRAGQRHRRRRLRADADRRAGRPARLGRRQQRSQPRHPAGRHARADLPGRGGRAGRPERRAVEQRLGRLDLARRTQRLRAHRRRLPELTAPNDYCYGPASADGTPVPILPPDALATSEHAGHRHDRRDLQLTAITIPATPYPVPLFDVRIIDNLNGSAADLTYVSVTKVAGSGAWTPVNTGDTKNLVIEDTATGIDIAPGEQVVLDITVRLDDTPVNVAGLAFTNTADYTYNRLNDAPATILRGHARHVAADDRRRAGADARENRPAADAARRARHVHAQPAQHRRLAGVQPTIYDVLPNQADGGTCDAAPTNVSAQVFEADGTTAVSPVLAEGADFTVAFVGDPDCTVTVNMLTPAGAIGADQRLIVTYQAALDTDSQQGASLTNVAGATEWFSIDVSDAANLNYARTYTRVVTDGTVGTLDHEDAHTVAVFTPVLVFEKYAINVTTGENPATVATPGDRIRYGLRVENVSDTPLAGFSIVDELDRLNGAAGLPAGHAQCGHCPGRRHRRLQPERRHRGHGPARYQRPLARRHRRQPAHRVRGRPCAGDPERHLRLQPVHRRVRRLPGRGQRRPERERPGRPERRRRRGPDADPHPVGAGIRRRQDLDLPRRRPERAARRRDAALHDHRAEHRHGQCHRRRDHGPGAGQHRVCRRQHDAER